MSVVGGDASARVSWTAPPDGSSPILRYEVRVSPGGRIIVEEGTATSATISGLTNGTDYVFEVRAINSVGESPWSHPATGTPSGAPGAPTGVMATAGVESATIEWTAPASDGGRPITGYKVVSSPGGKVATVGSAARQATIYGLTAGTSHTFTVTAVNEVGEVTSAPSNAVKPAPAGVTGLSRTVRFDPLTASAPKPRVELAWTKQGSPDAIEVTWTDGSTSRSVTLTPAPSAYTVTGLDHGKAYTFRVRAVAGGVDSTPASASTSGSAMTSAVKPATVTSGASTKVSGRLTRAGTTTGLGDQPVQLQIRTQNASRVWSVWSNVGSPMRTTSTGTYAIAHRTPRNAQYRVLFTGVGGRLGSVSPMRAVNVAPRVTAALSTASMRLDSTTRLTGKVSPNLAGKTVHLQKRVGDRWVDVRGMSQRLTSTSTYRFSIKPGSRGTHTYRVRVPAYAPYVKGFSPSRTLTVS